MKLDELMRDISACHGVSAMDGVEEGTETSTEMEEDMYPKKTIMDDKTLQELVNTISFDIDTKMLTTISKLSALHNVDYDIGEDMAKKKEQIDELWKKITGNPPPDNPDNPSIFTAKTEGGAMSFECRNELCAVCAWYIINEFVPCALLSQTGEVIVRGLTGQYKVSALQQAGFFTENVTYIANAIWETVCADAASYPTARVEAEKYKREHSIDAWIDHVESGDTANPFAKNLRQIREMASALHRHKSKTCVKEPEMSNEHLRDRLNNYGPVSRNFDTYSPYVPIEKTSNMLLEPQRNTSMQMK